MVATSPLRGISVRSAYLFPDRYFADHFTRSSFSSDLPKSNLHHRTERNVPEHLHRQRTGTGTQSARSGLWSRRHIEFHGELKDYSARKYLRWKVTVNFVRSRNCNHRVTRYRFRRDAGTCPDPARLMGDKRTGGACLLGSASSAFRHFKAASNRNWRIPARIFEWCRGVAVHR